MLTRDAAGRPVLESTAHPVQSVEAATLATELRTLHNVVNRQEEDIRWLRARAHELEKRHEDDLSILADLVVSVNRLRQRQDDFRAYVRSEVAREGFSRPISSSGDDPDMDIDEPQDVPAGGSVQSSAEQDAEGEEASAEEWRTQLFLPEVEEVHTNGEAPRAEVEQCDRQQLAETLQRRGRPTLEEEERPTEEQDERQGTPPSSHPHEEQDSNAGPPALVSYASPSPDPATGPLFDMYPRVLRQSSQPPSIIDWNGRAFLRRFPSLQPVMERASVGSLNRDTVTSLAAIPEAVTASVDAMRVRGDAGE